MMADTPASSSVCGKQTLVIPDDLCVAELKYRECRDAYISGSSDKNYLVLYITLMSKLGYIHELFYLSHKLSSSAPNDACSWYCVGAYYWSCGKLEQSHKYLKKALKKNKDFGCCWILLGHVLSAVEESEQALAAYRTAVRLLPDNYVPLLCIGKEFIRTNNLWLAAHILQSARALQTSDVIVLNELGVCFVKLGKLDEAASYFQIAIDIVRAQTTEENCTASTSNSVVCELLYNYATLLRKQEQFEEALVWYQRSLSLGPLKAAIIAAIGYTLHLLRRFEEAVTSYHQALSLEPKYTFCAEMLTHAMEDIILYKQENMNIV